METQDDSPDFTDEPQGDYADEPGGDYAPGGEEFAPSPPPGVGDALSQMNQRLADLEAGGQLDRGDPGGYDDRPAEDFQPDLSPEEAVNQFIDGRVQEQLAPVLDGIEFERRQGDVLALAEKYPSLRNEETIDAIEHELAGIAEAYDNPGVQSDPRMIEMALLAHEARAAAASAEPPPAPATPQGQHIETGAGTGAATPQVDPVEAAYTRALTPPETDSFGYPVR